MRRPGILVEAAELTSNHYMTRGVQMNYIAPSILSADFTKLGEEIAETFRRSPLSTCQKSDIYTKSEKDRT